MLTQVEALYCRGVDFKRLFEELALQFRNLLVARSVSDPEARKAALGDLADSEREAAVEMSKNVDPAQLARLFDLVHGAVWDVSRAAQPRLAAEVALLKGIHLAPSQSVASAIARVEALTRQLTGPAVPGSSAVSPISAQARPFRPFH